MWRDCCVVYAVYASHQYLQNGGEMDDLADLGI